MTTFHTPHTQSETAAEAPIDAPPGPSPLGPNRRKPAAIWTAVLGLVALVAVGALVAVLIGGSHHAESTSPSPAGGPMGPHVSTTESTEPQTTDSTAANGSAPAGDEPATIEEAGDRCAGGEAAGCDALSDACAGGDLLACDVLWAASPIGSSYEAFGNSCGDRIDMEFRGGCDEYLESGADCVDDIISACDDLYEGCDAGDMVACDVLYVTSAAGSDYEQFGATCGNRADPSFADSCIESSG